MARLKPIFPPPIIKSLFEIFSLCPNADSVCFVWSELIITYSPSGASLKGPKYSTIYGGTNTTGYSYGDSGTLTFEHGKMYVTRVAIQLILLIGTLQAIRNKGDFDGDNNIDIDDAYSLAKYLVQINPEFSNIASAITTEASSGNTDWANLKSTAGNNPDLRDLVHLISQTKAFLALRLLADLNFFSQQCLLKNQFFLDIQYLLRIVRIALLIHRLFVEQYQKALQKNQVLK